MGIPDIPRRRWTKALQRTGSRFVSNALEIGLSRRRVRRIALVHRIALGLHLVLDKGHLVSSAGPLYAELDYRPESNRCTFKRCSRPGGQP